ncbi:type VI secretion system lipoprotein TssJ [Pelagibaculum spongiae]|uniref:Type VI secretion system lipoprotein TssJ n=1 Tax=Pelagibaculum spongiae TaxID=2080658 RepID=A0A2V1GT53_9GAMM|nr:type VI secretion system lipoprotein TssJ [Pelagibaculum spongiae]PVZ68778.1 type VI secretion system lipoprotein TssJ [Pelagibaculum spongiae]
MKYASIGSRSSRLLLALFSLSIIFLSGAISGCGAIWQASSKTAKVIWQPDIPVGEPQNLPTKITYSLVAQNWLNPNPSGDSSPIEFNVFQLEDDAMFLAADYDQLNTQYEKSLGTNYLDHSEYALLPGQFKFIGPFNVEDDANYIGIVAKFSDPERSLWKKVIKVKPIGREYHLLMMFAAQDVTLTKVE